MTENYLESDFHTNREVRCKAWLLSCDNFIVTYGKDVTNLNARIVKDTLGTLHSLQRILIRNIYDQENQKDK